MNAQTAVSAAFARAGYFQSDADRLEVAAVEALRACDGDHVQAAKRVMSLVMSDERMAYVAVDVYLRQLKERKKELPSEGQPINAPIAPSNACPAQQPVEGGDSQRGSVGNDHIAVASPSSPKADRSSRVTDARSGQVAVVRPVGPTPAQRAAALVSRAETALTVLDTYKLANGMVIGQLRFGQLEGLRTHSLRDAMLIRQIQKHCVADPETKVKDALKADDLQRMIQKAAELADAA